MDNKYTSPREETASFTTFSGNVAASSSRAMMGLGNASPGSSASSGIGLPSGSGLQSTISSRDRRGNTWTGASGVAVVFLDVDGVLHPTLR